MTDAVLLVSHGSVDDLDDLPAFVTNVRRGHTAPPELIQELRRRYKAIGGSPLNRINADVTRELERRLGMAVAWANRLSRPYVRDVIVDLAKRGVTRAAVVALAQHSAHIYAEDARRAAEGTGIDVICAPNWGRDAGLCTAFASRIATTLAASSESPVSVVMTAHSLPRSAVDRGDSYEREVRDSAHAVAETLRIGFGHDVRHVVAFQSQGMAGVGSAAAPWLGPDLRETFDDLQRRGDRRVVVAPIGFLADNVEILYDLDVDARQMAIDRGLSYGRAPSLNADADFIDVLARVARPLLDDG